MNDTNQRMAKLMADSMRNHAANIVLASIVFKAGKAPRGTQLDFIRSLVVAYRNEVIALTFSHLIHCLYETKNAVDPITIIKALFVEAEEQLTKSHTTFTNLYDHLREDHKEELLNLAHSLGLQDKWKE